MTSDKGQRELLGNNHLIGRWGGASPAAEPRIGNLCSLPGPEEVQHGHLCLKPLFPVSLEI